MIACFDLSTSSATSFSDNIAVYQQLDSLPESFPWGLTRCQHQPTRRKSTRTDTWLASISGNTIISPRKKKKGSINSETLIALRLRDQRTKSSEVKSVPLLWLKALKWELIMQSVPPISKMPIDCFSTDERPLRSRRFSRSITSSQSKAFSRF